MKHGMFISRLNRDAFIEDTERAWIVCMDSLKREHQKGPYKDCETSIIKKYTIKKGDPDKEGRLLEDHNEIAMIIEFNIKEE